ncbi:MAG: T9SS type A sorting domain-containing protein [Bacteroidota bacterium]|nr:T9SS type A sorting domain-containing protein [Bacteroidota bacterium]
MKHLFLISFVILSFFSVEAQQQPLTYKMYPNPMTSDVLEVSFQSGFKSIKNLTFVISNVIGQTVFQYSLTEEDLKKGVFVVKIDQIKLEKGFYLTKISNGELSTVQKLVVR